MNLHYIKEQESNSSQKINYLFLDPGKINTLIISIKYVVGTH